jgi:Cu-Zn family superoxide dismutase
MENPVNKLTISLACAALLATGIVGAAPPAGLSVTMHVVSATGVGAALGTVLIEETPYGVVFTPALAGLEPGMHGFHVHENGNCGPAEKDGKPGAALAAGGHYDPDSSKKHGLPWGDGHRGDLPALVVDAKGGATLAVLAPRLKLAELKGKALMIHVGGDNHADHPQMLGGGGPRMACAVLK